MSVLIKLIGENLRIIRLAKGLTQEELAEKTGKLGISKSRISDIERGQTNISMKTLEMLMNALEIQPNELFDFQKLASSTENLEKTHLLNLHHSILMNQDIDIVKHVCNTTASLLEIIDLKAKGK